VKKKLKIGELAEILEGEIMRRGKVDVVVEIMRRRIFLAISWLSRRRNMLFSQV